jgi:hypothetical protein
VLTISALGGRVEWSCIKRQIVWVIKLGKMASVDGIRLKVDRLK